MSAVDAALAAAVTLAARPVEETVLVAALYSALEAGDLKAEFPPCPLHHPDHQASGLGLCLQYPPQALGQGATRGRGAEENRVVRSVPPHLAHLPLPAPLLGLVALRPVEGAII